MSKKLIEFLVHFSDLYYDVIALFFFMQKYVLFMIFIFCKKLQLK